MGDWRAAPARQPPSAEDTPLTKGRLIGTIMRLYFHQRPPRASRRRHRPGSLGSGVPVWGNVASVQVRQGRPARCAPVCGGAGTMGPAPGAPLRAVPTGRRRSRSDRPPDGAPATQEPAPSRPRVTAAPKDGPAAADDTPLALRHRWHVEARLRLALQGGRLSPHTNTPLRPAAPAGWSLTCPGNMWPPGAARAGRRPAPATGRQLVNRPPAGSGPEFTGRPCIVQGARSRRQTSRVNLFRSGQFYGRNVVIFAPGVAYSSLSQWLAPQRRSWLSQAKFVKDTGRRSDASFCTRLYV